MATYYITGDGWAQGEISQTGFAIPPHIENPSDHRYWRTSSCHTGLAHYMQNAMPDANIYRGGGYAHNNSQSVSDACKFTAWWGHIDGIVMFWSSPELDYNPYNLSSQNWHGIPEEQIDSDMYYILPTNRWANTTIPEFQDHMAETVHCRFKDLNQLDVPVYLIGGSAPLPGSEFTDPYPNIHPVVNFSGELWYPGLLTGLDYLTFSHKQIIKAYRLYRKTHFNPVSADLLSEFVGKGDPINTIKQDASISIVGDKQLYDRWHTGDQGNRKLHELIWKQLEPFILQAK
jgi:hypothetical protein